MAIDFTRLKNCFWMTVVGKNMNIPRGKNGGKLSA